MIVSDFTNIMLVSCVSSYSDNSLVLQVSCPACQNKQPNFSQLSSRLHPNSDKEA